MRLITHSELRCQRTCQRKHKLRYLEGYRPSADAEALRFGTLMHEGLEAWFKTPPGLRLGAALDAMRAGNPDPLDLVRAEVLMCGYDARWGAVEMEVLAVEVQFEADLLNPGTGAPSKTFRLAGKIDAVIRAAGRVLLVEHKTSSDDITAGSDYWRRLRLDGQVSTYFDGGAALGFEVDGCLYDVIAKPAIRPLKATPEASRKYTKDGRLYAIQRAEDETLDEFRARLVEAVVAAPERYFQRGEVTRFEAELEEARYDRWQQAIQIRTAERLGHAPRNPEACLQYSGCEYFDVCTGCASLADPSRFICQSTIHPELNQEEACPV